MISLVGNDDVDDVNIDSFVDVVCEVLPVDVVLDDVRVVASQADDYDDGNDALMHAKERASKGDEKRLVRQAVVNKDVYEDVMSMKRSLLKMWSKLLNMSK